MFHETMAIAITGNPGVGKHTISKEILKHIEYSILDINQIAKNSNLLEPNNNVNDVDVEKLEKIISQKIFDSNLIVGHLAPYVISPDKIEKIIVLRRNPYELLDVYRERGYSKEKAKENAGSEVLGIISFDTIIKFKEKVHQVDVSGKTIKEVSDIVLSIIKGNHFSEEVDWLSMITEKNDLKKFFAD
jgi:adenylate kinase